MLSTNITTSSTCHPPPEAITSPALLNSALHQHNSSPVTVEPQQPSNPVQAVTAAQHLPSVPITSPSAQPTQPHGEPSYYQLPALHPPFRNTDAAQSPLPIAGHGWVQPLTTVQPIDAPVPASTPYPGVQPQLATDLLIASAFGIPKPMLPVFESGRESDFALLKMALDNLLNSHKHLSEQYKYKILLSHLKHHPSPYTAALKALLDKHG